jgi:hypothetical protein
MVVIIVNSFIVYLCSNGIVIILPLASENFLLQNNVLTCQLIPLVVFSEL